MIKFTPSFSACAALILLGFGVTPLANATPWTFYTKGTISSGADPRGIFGSVSTDLAGLTYSQLFTLDPSLYASQIQIPGTYNNLAYGTLTGTATDTITVGGVPTTFTFDLTQYNSGEVSLHNALTQSGPANYDEAFQYQSGFTAQGLGITAQSFAYSTANPFNLGLSFNQNWSHTLQLGDNGSDQFQINDPNGSNASYLFGTPTFISINAPVPEPETYVMLLAGLCLLGFTAWRRKNLAA